MAKKSAGRRRPTARPGTPPASGPGAGGDGVPVVGAREPCPCGSGRRYKACHGRSGNRPEAPASRTFDGLPGECDWVALREIVPAATAPLQLGGDLAGRHADRDVTLATVLPMAVPAMVRPDGSVLVGLQVSQSQTDPSRDLAAALLTALEAEPGLVPVAEHTAPNGPRLQDLLDLQADLAVTVHEGFGFWEDGDGDPAPEIAASRERADEAAVPTARLSSVEAAYWCEIRGRHHLRWVMPQDEEALLDAMARLHAADADRVGEGSRYVGSFRAHGLLVPVWDLPAGATAAALEEPAAGFARRLGEALADTTPLDDEQRRARAGLRSRQLTLR